MFSLGESGHHTPPPALDSPPAFSFEDTLFIFDWDDTLLASSWLAMNGLRLDEPAEVPAEARAQLSVLAGSVKALLERAQKHGRVVVITNAETGWVELSARKFMPSLLPTLAKLRVVSARSTYEALHPDSPSEWKVAAFQQELSAAFAGRRADANRNVVSLGDSVHERTAIHKVTAGGGAGVRTKSIKFVERPTVEQLKRQLDLVYNCVQEIAAHNGHLDLMLTIAMGDGGATP